MKYIKTSWFPFGNYIAINLFGIIFYKNEITEITKNHESIHDAQAKDFSKIQIIGYLIFYLIYVSEWIINLIKYPHYLAYENISFEKEAKLNEKDFNYIKTRSKFNFIKYI